MLSTTFLIAVLAFREAGPTPIPFERVRDNAQAWIQAHPDDAFGHEVLGRAHLFTYLTARDYVFFSPLSNETLEPLTGVTYQSWRDGYPPKWSKTAFRTKRWAEQGAVPWTPSAAESLDHVAQAVRELRRAVALAPTSARTQLALAYALEKCAHMAPMVDSLALFELAGKRPLERDAWLAWESQITAASPTYESALRFDGIEDWCAANWPYVEPLRADGRPLVQRRAAELLTDSWTSLALAHYREAFTLASPEDDKLEEVKRRLRVDTIRSSEVVSFEAGEAIQRILTRFDREDERVRELWKIVTVQMDELSALGPKPSRAISPLVLSFSAREPDAMLSLASRVCFDLDGQGDVGPWSWVRPGTAFVVWDPLRKARIESGRDLFGEATFGLFPRDGFAALSLLDDDHDGWVQGAELDGVRLWFDVDGDGRSTVDEVRDPKELAVIGLRCEGPQRAQHGLLIADGVRLEGGESLPLLDWMASSAR